MKLFISNFLKNTSIIVLLCLGFVTFSQSKEQNLELHLHQKIKNYTKKANQQGLKKQFDSAYYYFEKSRQLSTEISNLELIAYSDLTNARLLYWQGKTTIAKPIITKIITNKIIHDSIKIYANFLIGEIYSYEKNYVLSLQHFLTQVKSISEKKTILINRDSAKLAISFYRIGNIHFQLKNFNKATSYYKQAHLFTKKDNFKSVILSQIAAVFENTENTQKAIKYSKKATELAAKNNWQLMLPTYYKSLSKYYLQVHKSDSAIYYAKKGLQNNTYCRLNGLNSNIGEGYLQKGEFSKATRYFKTALKYATANQKLQIYEFLRKSYTQSKKYKLAISINAKYLILKDSLDTQKVQQEIIHITEKYESDKKQLKIKTLNDKNELNNIVIKKQQTQIILFVLLFVFSTIILGLVLFFYFRQRKQQNLLYHKNRELAKQLEQKWDSKNSNLNVKDAKKEKILLFIKSQIQEEFYLDKNISLSKMAKNGTTNTSYLSKIINEDYDKSFTNFINDLRISYTLKKLESIATYKNLTIEDIGWKAGFASSNAFYRAFRKYTGLTPSYYIKRTLQQA